MNGLVKALEKEGFKVSVQYTELGQEMLLVDTPSLLDPGTWDLTLVHFLEGEVDRAMGLENALPLIQITAIAQFQIQKTTVNDLTALINAVNKALLFPAFLYDPVDSKLAYRCTLPLSAKDEEFTHIATSLQLIVRQLEQYSFLLEEVGSDRLSYAEVLKTANEKAREYTDTLGELFGGDDGQ